MSQRRAVLLAALALVAAVGAILLVRAPTGNCILRSSGGIDPVEQWMTCDTRLGTRVSVPVSYNDSGHAAAVSAQAWFWSVIAGLAAAAATYATVRGRDVSAGPLLRHEDEAITSTNRDGT